MHGAAYASSDELLQLAYDLSVKETQAELLVSAEDRSALHFAALSRSQECAEMLLDWGMDIYHRDGDGLTPVDYCADMGFVFLTRA